MEGGAAPGPGVEGGAAQQTEEITEKPLHVSDNNAGFFQSVHLVFEMGYSLRSYGTLWGRVRPYSSFPYWAFCWLLVFYCSRLRLSVAVESRHHRCRAALCFSHK